MRLYFVNTRKTTFLLFLCVAELAEYVVKRNFCVLDIVVAFVVVLGVYVCVEEWHRLYGVGHWCMSVIAVLVCA